MTVWRTGKRRTAAQPHLPGVVTPQDKTGTRRLATPAEHAVARAHGRLTFTVMMFVIAYLVIAARLTDLTVINNNNPDAPPLVAASEAAPVASRTDITDRNGVVLATSLPTVSLCADGHDVIDAGQAAQKLLGVLPHLDAEKLRNDLRSGKHCVMLKRHLTPRQYYEVNKLGIAGLEFIPDERRVYPAGNITAHVLGFSDIDDRGIAGLEKSQNNRLEQDPGPLKLTLDLRVQTIMHDELKQAMDKYHAEGGVGVVMDVNSGEVLSMVSLPDFDPNHAGEATDDEKFNRDTLGVYEMGSTFKIFNTAMALDSGLIKVADRFDTMHPLEVGHRKIHDFHPATHWLNVAEILMESSNIGSALMAQRLGGVRQRTFLEHLGLTQRSPLELPEIGQPLVPSAANWSESTTMTTAFGHGIAVSAIQLVSAVCSIINGGYLVRPTLLAEDKASTNNDDHPLYRVISARTAAQMRGLMRLVVLHGTGKDGDVDGYEVGGKTGTADKVANGRYVDNARLSSFIGVFPINAPRYLVFALLDDPKGDAATHGFATGGWTAAPVVSHVISQIGPMLGIAPLTPEMTALADHEVLRPLGSELLDSLSEAGEKKHYASVESHKAQ